MARLQALLATNRATPRRYEIADAKDGAEATVYVYDLIDAYLGVSAQQFVKDLAGIKASTIHLRINSPGGDVFEGRAIATAIRAHGAKVVAHVDGLAASAASWIALAADEVEIAPGAMMMIHRASSIAWGNADDMLQLAALLEKIDGTLVDEYVRETGNTAENVRTWLDAETWFTAEEAVALGFADRLSEDAPAVDNRWNLSAFPGAPAAAPAAEPVAPAEPEPAVTEGQSKHADNLRRFGLTEKQTA